jgi:hypothetical protein
VEKRRGVREKKPSLPPSRERDGQKKNLLLLTKTKPTTSNMTTTTTDSSSIDWDAEGRSLDDEVLGNIDYSAFMSDDDARDRLRNQRISYSGDNINIRLYYIASRYLVELLAVSPRFQFVGDLYASDCNHRSLYYCSPKRGEFRRNLDSHGNLILHADGVALEDDFYMEIKIPGDEDAGEKEDVGFLMFAVDAHDCNRVMTQTLSTARRHRMVLTFIPMHTAIQVNVQVTLDLVSASGAGACYVDGEISAHHEFYNEERVVLFSRREEDKAEVVDGELPLSRTWAAVPISVEPLLIIKLSLRVRVHHDGDCEGHTILFGGDLTFYRDQREKTMFSADHGQERERERWAKRCKLNCIDLADRV